MLRAAVATVVREHAGALQVLLIKRAEKEGDRWSGHIAFPGGRAQTEDADTRSAAVRETSEEVGLDLSQHRCIGRLSDVMTLAHGAKQPMVISPYIFRIDHDPIFSLNHEVAEVLWLPVSFLTNHGNRQTMRWEKRGVSMTLPCYVYRGERIWGITLKMLDELTSLESE